MQKEIYSHELATKIIDIVEDMLAEKGIAPLPDTCQREYEDEAIIYGETFGKLSDDIENCIIAELEYCNANFVPGRYRDNEPDKSEQTLLKMAYEAFELKTWLIGNRTGGTAPYRNILSSRQYEHCGVELAEIRYQCDELCGLMDSPYHNLDIGEHIVTYRLYGKTLLCDGIDDIFDIGHWPEDEEYIKEFVTKWKLNYPVKGLESMSQLEKELHGCVLGVSAKVKDKISEWAQNKIKGLKKQVLEGKILVENGVAYWAESGNVIADEVAEALSNARFSKAFDGMDFTFDREATAKARAEQYVHCGCGANA